MTRTGTYTFPDETTLDIEIECDDRGEPLNLLWKMVYNDPEKYAASMVLSDAV